ncbi:MAG: isopentenyl-diphosphate Delta-isomerase [Prolixibacteraceae bacterium]|nr:isopentenyl-diphosphate Delta-isomerase [Prolixibacteraceae bacterium]
MTAKNDFVILVDEQDNEIGHMEKLEVHRKALLHRAVSIFICNSNGEWLLQRRALNKYHSKGLWSNTCCSHPYPGETVTKAAHRRLYEEMGLESELHNVYSFTYIEKLDNDLTEHEYDHVFVGITDSTPIINPSEVLEWKYESYENIFNEIKNHPEMFTVWFRKIFEEINSYLVELTALKK